MERNIPVDERLELLNYKAAYRAFTVMNIMLILFIFALFILIDNLLISFLAFAVWFTGNVIYEYKSQEYAEYRLKYIFSNKEQLRRLLKRRLIGLPLTGILMFSMQYWGNGQDLHGSLLFAFIMMVCMPVLEWWLEKREAKRILEKEKAEENIRE